MLDFSRLMGKETALETKIHLLKYYSCRGSRRYDLKSGPAEPGPAKLP